MGLKRYQFKYLLPKYRPYRAFKLEIHFCRKMAISQPQLKISTSQPYNFGCILYTLGLSYLTLKK